MNNEETEILNECFDALYYNVTEKLKVEANSSCFGIDTTPKCFGEQYIGSKKSKHNNIKRKRRK
jgi:hypothetical protein